MSKKYQGIALKCIWLSISQNQSLASAFSFQKMLVHHSGSYLRTRVIGSVEALEVLMGFHQYQMTRQVIFFLQTELVPTQRMLKPRVEIESLPEDDEDLYLKTKFETYLQQPTQLACPSNVSRVL